VRGETRLGAAGDGTTLSKNWSTMDFMPEEPVERAASTDAVCERYAGKAKIRLEIRESPPTDDGDATPALFVEADATGFEFLGNLLIAFARSKEGCHRHVGPNTAGSAHFQHGCRLDVLLHRLPCEHPETALVKEWKRLV
jgi:hypothetical protein